MGYKSMRFKDYHLLFFTLVALALYVLAIWVKSETQFVNFNPELGVVNVSNFNSGQNYASLVTPTVSAQSEIRIWLPIVIANSQSSNPTPMPGFYVAPNGTSNGDGSWEHPWDLTTALAHPAAVQPGDIIWLRGGIYKGTFISFLTGTAQAPIIVRQYPGERATLDLGGPDPNFVLAVQGAWTLYWGFEVVNSNPNPESRISGVTVYGPHTKFINMLVHNHTGNGFGFWKPAQDAEIYGSIIYNNGRSKLEHGIYTQNQVGTKHIIDNIIFKQAGYGIHAYGSSNAYVRGYQIEGNAIFDSGLLLPDESTANILISGGTSAERINIVNNYTYYSVQDDGINIYLASEISHKDFVLQNNYLAGGDMAMYIGRWNKATVTGNKVYSNNILVWSDLSNSGTYNWTNNTYYSPGNSNPFYSQTTDFNFADWQQQTGFDQESQYSANQPAGVDVFIRPNQYEDGRANIIIYNWDLLDVVKVDVSGILPVGASYQVKNVQDYYGPPVVSGIFNGQLISLPMTSLNSLSQVNSQKLLTGSEFNVFVLITIP